MDVHFLVHVAELIDLTCMASIFELPMGPRDVALAGVEESTENGISIVHGHMEGTRRRKTKVLQEGSIIIDAVNHITLPQARRPLQQSMSRA